MGLTTTNVSALFRADQELRRCHEELARLRAYRKRARRSYRSLQAAYERVSGAYADLYRLSMDLRQENARLQCKVLPQRI